MQNLAVFHQATAVPEIDGVKKPMKPGGYQDSSADIAYQVSQQTEYRLIQPPAQTDKLASWSFPDTNEGILAAVRAGAKILWMNTNLYEGHPIENFRKQNLKIVGHRPSVVQSIDDKWETFERLRKSDPRIPVVPGWLVDRKNLKIAKDLNYPLILKPRRGRGSEGVVVTSSYDEFLAESERLFEAYGETLILEKFLSGRELTISILPPGRFSIGERMQHWSLPAVERSSHENGIMPYNGRVAVSENSFALDPETAQAPEVVEIVKYCEKVAALLGTQALIRIDVRRDEASSRFFMIDINAKPNMTGPGRPGRENQINLTGIAAASAGWSYGQLIKLLSETAWLYD